VEEGSAHPADQAYATPLVIRVGDRDQLVSPGAYRAAAYDPLTGDEIWRCQLRRGVLQRAAAGLWPGPRLHRHRLPGALLIAVRPDGKGDVTRSHKAWTLTRGAPYTPSPLLVGNDLYVVSDTGVLTLVDATSGDVVQQQRLGGNYSASPVFADGRIYFQSEEGVTTVLAPGRDLRRLARIASTARCWRPWPCRAARSSSVPTGICTASANRRDSRACLYSYDLFRELYRHMEWADASVWKAALAHDAACADAPLRDLLHHAHMVQQMFLCFWTDRSPFPSLSRKAAEFQLADLRDWARPYYADVQQLFDAATMRSWRGR
jgi:hypothetical protein